MTLTNPKMLQHTLSGHNSFPGAAFANIFVRTVLVDDISWHLRPHSAWALQFEKHFPSLKIPYQWPESTPFFYDSRSSSVAAKWSSWIWWSNGWPPTKTSALPYPQNPDTPQHAPSMVTISILNRIEETTQESRTGTWLISSAATVKPRWGNSNVIAGDLLWVIINQRAIATKV